VTARGMVIEYRTRRHSGDFDRRADYSRLAFGRKRSRDCRCGEGRSRLRMKVLLAFVFRIFELPSLFFFLELARGAGAPFFLGVFRRSFSFFPHSHSHHLVARGVVARINIRQVQIVPPSNVRVVRRHVKSGGTCTMHVPDASPVRDPSCTMPRSRDVAETGPPGYETHLVRLCFQQDRKALLRLEDFVCVERRRDKSSSHPVYTTRIVKSFTGACRWVQRLFLAEIDLSSPSAEERGLFSPRSRPAAPQHLVGCFPSCS
jgi:hypothetical protein